MDRQQHNLGAVDRLRTCPVPLAGMKIFRLIHKGERAKELSSASTGQNSAEIQERTCTLQLIRNFLGPEKVGCCNFYFDISNCLKHFNSTPAVNSDEQIRDHS